MLGQKMKVLVADDSQPIRERLVGRLERLPDVTVAEAVDTPGALHLAAALAPDVAVLDIRMPGGGGIAALGEIKKMKPDTTVIIMTNYPYAQYRRKCLEAGADFFFDKSTEFERIAETICQLMNSGPVCDVARRTSAAQLVEAKEELEKAAQQQHDMGILSLLHRPDTRNAFNQAYGMWEKTFDAMPDMVSIFDADRHIIRVNKAVADHMGVPAAELTGMKCYKCFHGTDCPLSGCPHEAMLKDRKEHVSEIYDEHLGGWFDISVSPVFEKDRLIGAIHIAQDITQRKKAEEAVKQSEQNLRYVVDSIRDGLWDWDVKRDIIKCSPQSYRMLGYEPDEFPMNYTLLGQMTHPDDWPLVEEAVRAYFCGETERYDIEFRLRRKDGAYHWVRVRGSLMERNAKGEPSRMMGIQSDIDEKRQAETALRESELRYRQLFESMQTGFALHEIICDERGVPCDYRFLEVNAAFEALTGLKAKDIVGFTVKEVLPDTEPVWIDRYGKVALTGQSAQVEEFSTALGRHYSVSVYSPRKGQFATIFTDVTAQKTAETAIRRARDAAEEANLAKTQFLANMSHELRTPLNAIIGLTELLEDSKLDEEQRDYVQTIGISGESLLTIIADMLDLSKIEMGKLKVKNEKFSIREVIRKAGSLLADAAGRKGIDLSMDVDGSVPESITGDADRLQQVLINLLNNGLKFTEKGFVRLTVRGFCVPSGSRRVEFSVEDSGEGMDQEILQRIFEPFQQGDNSNTREHGGVGLGLTISKNLVEMMGGSIQVESRKGHGSVFTFHLMDQTAPQENVPVDEVRNQWRGKCVCVWDDDPANMRTAEVLLERIGVMPRYAESLGSIHQRLTGEVAADAVLCNLDMPGLMEMLAEFRTIRPGVPWIGFSRWDIVPEPAVRKYFSAFVDRPLRPAQLYETLLRVAANS